MRVPSLAILALLAAALFALLEFGIRPASAQFFGFGQPQQRRAAQYNQFPFLFGGQPRYRDQTRRRAEPRRAKRRAPTQETRDTRPPPHRVPDVAPAKNVLVFGDAMADWLAYGLEEAFAEANSEFGVTRKARSGVGLIRNDTREPDWAQTINEASEKPDFIVIMTGLGDRRAITEARAKTPPTERKARGATPDPAQATEAEKEVAHEFRSEKWIELYAKRIDQVIAAAKAKQVPVIWVGLPPVRGARSRQDIPYLNDIYRSSAEKAGIAYVDVWEGFTDESGDFANVGPDVIGQVRRLRAVDGVNFTKAGARKLAHYVDREIKRLLSRETPIALPIPSEAPSAAGVEPAAPSGPAPRPLAGPVIALTGGTAPAEDALIGARANETTVSDPLAVRVLRRGEPQPPQAGRADNFAWPGRNTVAANDIEELPALPAAVAATRPAEPAAPAASNTGQRGPSAASSSNSRKPRAGR